MFHASFFILIMSRIIPMRDIITRLDAFKTKDYVRHNNYVRRSSCVIFYLIKKLLDIVQTV